MIIGNQYDVGDAAYVGEAKSRRSPDFRERMGAQRSGQAEPQADKNAESMDEKAFHSVGPNAPEAVLRAWMEAAEETGVNGYGMGPDGMLTHITQFMVDSVVNGRDVLGSSMESAIQATERALYNLEHPLQPLSSRTEEVQRQIAKEKEFLKKFVEKLRGSSAGERTAAAGLLRTARADAVGKEPERTESMEQFKEEFYAELMGMSGTFKFHRTSVRITDAAWERMKAEPEYRAKMMGLLRRDLTSGYGPGTSISIHVGETEDEYRAYSWSDADSSYWKQVREREYRELREEKKKKRLAKYNKERMEKSYLENKRLQKQLVDRWVEQTRERGRLAEES